MPDTALTNETAELLQALIRNECVNDGRPESGGERRNADLLQTYLEGAGLAVQRFTSVHDRTSIVARIEGRDPSAPKLCLMGHTDVVPVTPSGWRNDPFGGEIIDGEIWGRGAIDMLNETASMAVAFKQLARTGFRPKGDLVYFGVADEEAGGTYGARWMVDEHWDAIACDYLLTEIGGWSATGTDGRRKITINVGEKGIAWRRIRVSGTPGHGSMPFGADSAVLKAAEVIRRIGTYRPAAQLDELWAATVDTLGVADDVKAGLLDPRRVWDTLETMPLNMAKRMHACSHTTFSPNVVHGGVKTNVIPDVVNIDVDIRTVPGTTGDMVDAHLREALGDMFDAVEVSAIFNDISTRSPVDNPLWHSIERRTRDVYPDSDLLPQLIVGATDARFFRDKGVVAYGTGLLSPTITMEDFAGRFHGHNERIDIESLGYCVNLWLGVIDDLVG